MTKNKSENKTSLIAAFHFKVVFAKSKSAADNSFQDVSGLSSELTFEEVEEGGENRFAHKLPKRIKHNNLVLKRGIIDVDSPLIKWCKTVLEGDLSFQIEPEIINIFLLDEKRKPLREWTITNAFPVKWDIDSFNSTKNEVAIETIELTYNTLIRNK